MKEITVELGSPFKYNPGKGDDIDATHITISEPTGKVAHLVAILKSELGAATKKSLEGIDLSGIDSGDEKDDDEGDAEARGKSGFAMLMMGGASMERVMVTLKEILRSTALVGGEKSFNTIHFDRMSYMDIEKTLKAYIGNFTKASES